MSKSHPFGMLDGDGDATHVAVATEVVEVRGTSTVRVTTACLIMGAIIFSMGAALGVGAGVALAGKMGGAPPLAKCDMVNTIFGSVYIQGGRVGLASYHFDAPDNVYISYKNAYSTWKLDDGSPPPVTKRFVNPHYDEAKRTFTGTVLWSDVSFNGDARWEVPALCDLSVFSPL